MLQFTKEYGEICPTGWNKDKEEMKASTGGVAGYVAKHAGKL